jgi:hypothetical protein
MAPPAEQLRFLLVKMTAILFPIWTITSSICIKK